MKTKREIIDLCITDLMIELAKYKNLNEVEKVGILEIVKNKYLGNK